MSKGVFIHPSAVVESADIGEGTRIWGWSHVMRGAKIGKNCNIGEHCFIENDVVIGDSCTIKNMTSVWDGILIEDNVFVGPSVVFTNDKYPRSRQEWEMSRTIVRRGASIGAGAVILCGIEIMPFAMIAAGAVVTKSAPPFTLVAGNPAEAKGHVCACGRNLGLKGGEAGCSKCGRFYTLRDCLSWRGGPPLP
ncbi:MAG: N-acetyltransferase [Nitrospirae bacterium]|nr:N-acetyltransferase [Nitrospirota bacterium]